MKKKLLLVGVAAMGLLAVGVGATSTFAWYTASATANVAAGTAKDVALSVGDPNYGLGEVNLPVVVEFSRVTGSTGDAVAGGLEMTKWYGSAPAIADPIIEIDDKTSGWDPALAAGLYAGTLDSGSKLHLYSAPSGGRKFVAVYKAHITIGTPGVYGDINWTDASMKQELAKRKAQIDLSAAKFTAVTAGQTYSSSTDYYTLSAGTATKVSPQPSGTIPENSGHFTIETDTSNGRIRFLDSTSTTVTKADGSTTYTLDNVSLAGIASGVDVYFGVRVEALSTAESGDIYAPFTATVADDGAIAG